MKLIDIILEDNDDTTFYEYFEVKNEVLYDIFFHIKDRRKYKFNKINPIIYKKALSEFVKYGKFFRFPEKYVFQWKNLMIRNLTMLDSLTEIYGHSQSFPFDEFYDVFDIPDEEQDNDFQNVFEILDTTYNIDDYIPHFSNGQPMISDFGLKPLQKLCQQLLKTEIPEEIIVIINKMLDVSHMRSNLPEVFIRGGSSSLDFITYDEKLNENKINLVDIFNQINFNKKI